MAIHSWMYEERDFFVVDLLQLNLLCQADDAESRTCYAVKVVLVLVLVVCI